MTLSIIIPVFNNFNILSQTIKSLNEQSFQDFSIIIVNNSPLSIPKSLFNLIAKDKVKVIENKTNAFYSKALNTAFKSNALELILFLNSDVILKKNSIKFFVNAIKEENFECVWGKMILPSKKTDSCGIYLSSSLVPRDIKNINNFNNTFIGPPGSCFLIKKSACLKIIDHFNDLFNEKISFYYTDADFALRLKKIKTPLKYLDFTAGIDIRSASIPKSILANIKFMPAPLKISTNHLNLLIANREEFLKTYPPKNILEKLRSNIYSKTLTAILLLKKMLNLK